MWIWSAEGFIPSGKPYRWQTIERLMDDECSEGNRREEAWRKSFSNLSTFPRIFVSPGERSRIPPETLIWLVANDRVPRQVGRVVERVVSRSGFRSFEIVGASRQFNAAAIDRTIFLSRAVSRSRNQYTRAYYLRSNGNDVMLQWPRYNYWRTKWKTTY